MQNNMIGNISVAKDVRERTLKNKSCSLETTMDFGTVMPAKVQRIYAHSSFQVSESERVYMTSLIAPCFGRMTLKGYHNFVAFSDIWANWESMEAEKSKYYGRVGITPSTKPYTSVAQLSYAVLMGAQMTIYSCNSNGYAEANLLQIPSNIPWNAAAGSLPAACQQAISDLGISRRSKYDLNNCYSILPKLFDGIATHSASIFLSNPQPASFFDYSSQHAGENQFGTSYVTLKGADYLIPVSVEYSTGLYRNYLLAFRLSSYGRRLRKILIGCGWQFNISMTDVPFTILPLVAYFKSYFDVFGLTLFQSWEQTYCYKLIQRYNSLSIPSLDLWDSNDTDSQSFNSFIFLELANSYYTEQQDFASAHIRQTGISPNPSGLLSLFKADVDDSGVIPGAPHIDITDITDVQLSESAFSQTLVNGHAMIDAVKHGQLDSEILKRQYLCTNRNTIAGAMLEKLLISQGLTEFVKNCKSRFIGKFELELQTYDLPAQSDTYQNVGGTSTGARTGEFGAYGLGHGSHAPVSYETDEDGYLITLVAIVPEGGYAETIDPDTRCITKYQDYVPLYDSVGMQFDAKSEIHGSQPWADMSGGLLGSLKDSFGLAPTYFNKKFGRNVLNGDFSLRSTRDSYAPWHLERMLLVGEHEVSEGYTPSGQTNVQRFDISLTQFAPNDMPIAGLVWRYITRYEWLARFNRIFYNDSSVTPNQKPIFDLSWQDSAQFEFFSLRDDNFIVHMRFNLPVYDMMLPVQDSFETTDDTRHANGSMTKA